MVDERSATNMRKHPPVPVSVSSAGGLRVSSAVAAFGADRLYDLIEREVTAWREARPTRDRRS